MTAGAGLEVAWGTEGAVEVAQQQGGDLQVKGVSELQHGIIKLGTLQGLGGEGSVEGYEQEAKRKAKAGREAHCMKAADSMQPAPSSTRRGNWGN